MMSETAVYNLSRDNLYRALTAAGVHCEDYTTEELRHRLLEARAMACTSSEPTPANKKAEPRPIMPPVSAKRKLEVQLPGTSWSRAVSLEATGTHGLLELWPAELGESSTAPSRAYQLGLSVTPAPGEFGRSTMLVVDHRVVLYNR